MHYTLTRNIPGIALFVNLRKAFDTIEWCFLRKTLQQFNFGPDLIPRFNTFCSDISSCVMNNGYSSEFFRLSRGVRQGCPLSGLLFVLGIEVLSKNIFMDSGIKGISVQGKEIELCQYADDTTCFLQNVESAKLLISKIQAFSGMSGLEINKSKTEALWLGKWKDRKDKPLGFKWSENPILALGVYFSYDKVKSDKCNFEEKLDKLEKALNIWRSRDLTIPGGINIVKSLALSKLIHVASVLPIPEGFAQKVNTLIYNFIWKDKPPKIKKSTCINR